MICPQCGADNADSKTLCHRCGGELGKPSPKIEKRRRPSLVFILIFLILSPLLVVLTLAMAKIPYEEPEVSEDAFKRLQSKILQAKIYQRRSEGFKFGITEEELNAYIQKSFVLGDLVDLQNYAGENVVLDDLVVALKEGGIEATIHAFYKRRRIHMNLAGKVKVEDSHASISIEYLKVGKLPIPSRFVPQILRRLKKGDDPLGVDIPSTIRRIAFRQGEMMVETRPEGEPIFTGDEIKVMMKQAVEKSSKEAGILLGKGDSYYEARNYSLALESYTTVLRNYNDSREAEIAVKRIARMEVELEKRERMRAEEEKVQKAISLLNIGNNYLSAGRYDIAIEYYRRVIEEYPDMAEAKEAGKRIEEAEKKRITP